MQPSSPADRPSRPAAQSSRRGWRKIDAWLEVGVEGCAMALFALFSVLCLWQVVARFVLNTPSSWTEPMVRLLMVWTVFLGAVVLVRRGMLISVSFLRDRAQGRARLVLDMITLVAGTMFFASAIWFGFWLVWRIRNQMLAGVNIPIFWAYLAVPVGALFCLVALWAHFADRTAPDVERDDARVDDLM